MAGKEPSLRDLSLKLDTIVKELKDCRAEGTMLVTIRKRLESIEMLLSRGYKPTTAGKDRSIALSSILETAEIAGIMRGFAEVKAGLALVHTELAAIKSKLP